MRRASRLSVLAGLSVFASEEVALADSRSIVTITTPRGVGQSFILIKPDHPVASVILFAGGSGLLRLNRVPPLQVGPDDLVAGNFLVRSRERFAAHGFTVAVVDAPADQELGMGPYFRLSDSHATDIGAVAEYLKREAGLPVWLVGTSAGSWSAARGAIGAGRDGIATSSIDGLVLTSTVTRMPQDSDYAKYFSRFASEYPDGVISMALDEINVPTLIVSHSDDACNGTPAADAPTLAKHLTRAPKVEIALVSGGDPPRSDPCQAYSQHGFLGVEQQAVDRIAEFIAVNGRRGR
jgi:hypothetical protein